MKHKMTQRQIRDFGRYLRKIGVSGYWGALIFRWLEQHVLVSNKASEAPRAPEPRGVR
jgi:hypothetical protein